MNDEQKELAALHALGALTPEEVKAFEKAMTADPELRAEFEELQRATAEFGRLIAPVTPPPGVKDRVIAEITKTAEATTASEPEEYTADRPKAGGWAALAWTLTAGFAITTSWLWSERTRLQKDLGGVSEVDVKAREQLLVAEQQQAALRAEVSQSKARVDALTGELEQWKKKNDLADMKIATLQSTVDEFRQGVAVVVWDAESQKGILKLEKLPPVEAQKDYQLWVVDPKKKDPVDAGVVRLDQNGFATIEFKPIDVVSEAAKFALSIEREGGVPKGEGPIVLIGSP